MDPSPEEKKPSPIAGRVVLEERDFVRAHVAYARARGAIRETRKTLALLLAITAVAVWIGWPVAPGVWCVMVVAALAAFVLAPRRHALAGRHAFARLHPTRREVTIELTDEGYATRAARSDHWASWRLSSGCVETEDAFVLESGTGIVEVFPKRAFGDRLDRVRGLLAYGVPLTPEAEEKARKKIDDRTLLVAIVIGTFLLVVAFTVFAALFRMM